MPGRSKRDGRDTVTTPPAPPAESAGTPILPSGKLLLRMPRSLHQRLLQRAAEEGTSANQLAVAILARGL